MPLTSFASKCQPEDTSSTPRRRISAPISAPFHLDTAAPTLRLPRCRHATTRIPLTRPGARHTEIRRPTRRRPYLAVRGRESMYRSRLQLNCSTHKSEIVPRRQDRISSIPQFQGKNPRQRFWMHPETEYVGRGAQANDTSEPTRFFRAIPIHHRQNSRSP